MSAPESQTSADDALSGLMGAIIDSPEYARLVSAPAARDWNAVQTAIDEYLDGYELRLDEGCHTPTEFERFLLVDAIAGLMEDDDFINALYSAVTAAPAAATGDAQDAARQDGFSDEIITALELLTAGGGYGSTYYCELLNAAGIDAVVERVSKEEMWELAGLDRTPIAVERRAAIAAQQGKRG